MDKEMIHFLVRAKKATYPKGGGRVESSRPSSHDLKYAEEHFEYYDSYFGTDPFIGEEIVCIDGQAIWSMNYAGRKVDESFNYDFLKEALLQVAYDTPFRGPAIYEKEGFTYTCSTRGDIDWFQGYESVVYQGRMVYGCYYHGGKLGQV